MYNSCNQTTGGAPFYKAEIVNHLRRAKAEGQLHNVVAGITRLYAITEVNPNTKTIPGFSHPVRVEESRDSDYWVIDLRPYAAKLAANKGELPDEGPLNLYVKRTMLELFWNLSNPLSLLKAGDMTLVTYANWLSGLLRVRLKTDPLATQQIRILCGYYHQQQYIDEETFTDKVKDANCIRLARLFDMSSENVIRFFEDVGYIHSLAELCETLRRKIDVSSIQLVDPGFIITLVGTSWFGSVDARELVAVALEYPPVLIAMVITATKERSYKKTLLAEIIQKDASRYKLDLYTVAINTLLADLSRGK